MASGGYVDLGIRKKKKPKMRWFQPVILAAGRGSRLSDLTTKVPKALLPIANRPMILYPIQMLDNHGFPEIMIIVLKSQRSLIETGLRPYIKCLSRIKRIEYVVIPDDEDWGTADSLRHIKDKVKLDLIVLSCDTVADIQLKPVADLHLAHEAKVTALLSHPSEAGPDMTAPGTKTKKKPERDFIGLEEKTQRLLFLASETDFEKTIDIQRSLVTKHPRIDFHSRLIDTHLYFIAKSVIELLPELKQMTSLKGEVIPYVLQLQYVGGKTPKGSLGEHIKIVEGVTNPLVGVTDPLVGVTDPLAELAKDLTLFGDLGGSSSSLSGDRNKIRCYAHVMKDRFCLRTNTLPNYCEANRQMKKHLKTFFKHVDVPCVHPSVTVPAKSQIGLDSLVDEGTLVSDKINVKKSNISQHCHLGEKVRITNSIIMDHVRIGEGCTIHNSIICPNAQIGEKSELKDTIIGSEQHVNSLSKFDNEVILDLESMMEI